jgi:hypothetical protein
MFVDTYDEVRNELHVYRDIPFGHHGVYHQETKWSPADFRNKKPLRGITEDHPPACPSPFNTFEVEHGWVIPTCFFGFVNVCYPSAS